MGDLEFVRAVFVVLRGSLPRRKKDCVGADPLLTWRFSSVDVDSECKAEPAAIDTDDAYCGDRAVRILRW